MFEAVLWFFGSVFVTAIIVAMLIPGEGPRIMLWKTTTRTKGRPPND